MGLTLVNLSDAYLQDRINTKGLTPFGIQTIREHFRILLNFYPEHFPNSPELSAFLGTKTPATRRSLLGTYRAFGKWLEKKHIMPNPWADIEMPKVPLPLLPAPTPEEVTKLFVYLDEHYPKEFAIRNKAIIALFMESGLRLFELASIQPSDIDWQAKTIRVWGKGRKEGKAPFGTKSAYYLKTWLSMHPAANDNLWGISRDGIQSTLKRLEKATGIKCNPHSFRRAFASMLRRMGVDSLTIKDLGRWENLEMVQRYTRSVQFEDSLKHYRSPLEVE